jgi:two-component system, NarL family, nitrate/nitrite response regulator NarL
VEAGKDNFSVIVTSADASVRKRWLAALNAQVKLYEATDLQQVERVLNVQQADLIILDAALLGKDALQPLSRLTLKAPDMRILMMRDNRHDADRILAIKAGVVGYCEHDPSPAVICKVVAAIRQGEVWLPRALITRLIDDFADTVTDSGKAALSEEQRQGLSSLTAREFEVARLVHKSANNKIIARELNISERTVKAHLSAIFRKLQVANRVRLALYFKELS